MNQDNDIKGNKKVAKKADESITDKALIRSKKQFKRGDVCTEADILKILRENHK